MAEEYVDGGMSGAIVVGTPKIVHLKTPGHGMTSIQVVPGAGGGVKVEYSLNGSGDIAGGVAVWTPWAKGTAGVVTAADSDTLVVPVAALRFTATVTNGKYSLVQ